MWTENKSGHMGKKSLAACDSSEEDKLGISSSSESEEDDDIEDPKELKRKYTELKKKYSHLKRYLRRVKRNLLL